MAGVVGGRAQPSLTLPSIHPAPGPLSLPEISRSTRAVSWEEDRGRKREFRGWDAAPGRGRLLPSCREPPYSQCVNGHITPSCPPATTPGTVGPNERKAGRAAVSIICMHGGGDIQPPSHPTLQLLPAPHARRASGHEHPGCSGALGLLSFQPSLAGPRPQPSLDPFWRQKFVCV